MNRYAPVRTNMDNEDNYNSPYDHHELETDAHYEAPSCLKRNPSGSLFIPSGLADSPPGESTLPLESRIKHSAYSPHHTLRAYSPHETTSSRLENLYTNSSSVYNVGSLGTRLGNTLLSRGGVGGGASPARSPNTEKFTNLDTSRSNHLPNYGSSGHLTVYHPSTHPLHNGTAKRPNSTSQSSTSFRLKSDLSGRCSWKFIAIFFMLFSFLLISALIYTAASNLIMRGVGGLENAQACAVIEDNAANALDDREDILKSGYDAPKKNQVASLPPESSSFKELPVGVKLAQILPPYKFWNFKLQQINSAYINFGFNIPRGASIGLYARRNAIPTITTNDIRDVLKGFREKRSTELSLSKSLSYYLEAGHWFISLYNDDSEPRQIELTASIRLDLSLGCPKGCGGHGDCVSGSCVCHKGFVGPDCMQSTCPVLCSGNGEYRDGACNCFPGWKGVECSIRHNECEVPDCNNHGECQAGVCVCSRGYTGLFCQQVDCADPTCSGRGKCLHGECHCTRGWTGTSCEKKEVLQACPQTCSQHGVWDIQLGVCRCDPGFIGVDCSKERCSLDCGEHGECEGGSCSCAPGWSGARCTVRECDPRCSAHGSCSNGTCLCTNGWNGKHCTLEGCPGNCGGHGTCSTSYELAWECMCESGWYGAGCDIQLESSCDDRIDNDKDGLVDCEDPECCESPVCERSQLCHTVSSPIDILLRKQPPAMTAPFYERMRFIIEENGLQSYAQKIAFNESRAAVVRGQVITPSGMGLIGVRVSTNGVNEGFTMTRDDGWFDLMVNGGGPVMLQFGRNPYSPLRLSLYVPWNEVMVLSPVKLTRREVHVQLPELYNPIPTCTQHDYNKMQPIVQTSWHSYTRGGSGTGAGILSESRVLRESLEIPGSNINLVYTSSRAKGYYSIIQLQLTPQILPDGLTRIHLIISIEGVQEDKLFEADPNLQYTYAWDRLNVYRQRVYGVTTANIKVGYEYSSCDLVWIALTTKVGGHDMVLSDIGTWNLNVHHKYNYHEGILQKGDGTNIYLKYTPLVVTNYMGTGQPRDVDCSNCNGPVAGKALLSPKSIAAGPDGSVFIVDHSLVRRISPEGEVTTLLQLNTTRTGYRNHLAHRTYTQELEHRQTLYIAVPDLYIIIKLKSVENPGNIERNWSPAIGSGERCLPGDVGECGDGGKAELAKLSYPKGIAVGPDGRVYIADGNNIRVVDEFGIISTLVGHQNHRSTWKPLPCSGAVPLADVQLNWPTDLAINPLDGTLHFIDDSMVLSLTKDGRVQIAAGRPLHCHPSQYQEDSPQSSALIEPQSISFSPRGELYIAESDSQRINRVRRVAQNKIETIGGKNSNCNCRDSNCKCFDPDSHLAASTRFSAISSIAVSPDGKLYIADQGNYRIRTVASHMPTNEEEEVFEVPDPDSQELYVFNRFGQHILTKDLLTKSLIYSMEYSQTTSTGKLVTIADSSGRKLTILRDYSGQVTALQTSNGQKHAVKVNRMGYLEGFDTPEGYSAEFHYVSSTGLLQSKLDSQNYGYMFKYDQYGRLIQSVSPSGEITFLTFNLTSHGGNIQVGETVLNVNDNKVIELSLDGLRRKETSILSDKSVEVKNGERKLTLATITHPVISHSHPIIGDSYPMIGEMRVESGSNLISKIDWELSLQTSGHDKQLLGINKKLRVNGENLLLVAYDKLQRREMLYLPDKTELLEIKYDENSRPITWAAPSLGHGGWATVSQRYDRFGHLEHWQRGEIQENYSYDKNGRLATVIRGNGTVLSYEYKDRETIPFKVRTGNGATFLIDYETKSGAVKSITTPRGHIHSWNILPDIGSIRWSYIAPWSTQPYSVIFNVRGFLQSVKYPGNEQVSYIYTNSGELQSIFAGQTEIEFTQEPESGFIESIFISQTNLDIREKRKYHSEWLKEQKLRFVGSVDFENAVIKYQWDGTGRPAKVSFSSGSKRERAAPECTWSYDQNVGTLQAVDSFQIRKSGFNRTEIQDLNGNFMKITELDGYGNFKRILYKVKRQQIFGFEFEYNNENLLHHSSITDENGRTEKVSYSYTVDQQLDKSWGNTNYDCDYDENGNMIMHSKDARRDTIIYGPGDRIESCGSMKIVYDTSGFVTAIDNERFLFNALGQLTEYINENEIKVRHYYDHLNRLVGWTDSAGGSSQYFYTNPLHPYQITYINNKNENTQKLTYDNNGHLIQIESTDKINYVACDQFGSPVLVFQPNGNVIKRLKYSPFGSVTDDSNSNIFIPIGFQGRIASKHGKFLLEKGRVYSSRIIQWLNPDWSKMLNKIMTPSDLFIYRFKNNNPNMPDAGTEYLTSMSSWAKLYGFNVEKIFHAAKPRVETQPEPFHQLTLTSLFPAHKIISETDSLVDNALAHLQDLCFIHPVPEVVNTRRVELVPKFFSSPPNFGRGFLLSVINSDTALVNPVEVQNSVVQKIFESVLNNSIYLDTSFTDSSKSVYYFVKPNLNRFSLDSDTVRRLAGEFTVSHKEIDIGKELSIVNDKFEVRVLYGNLPTVYRAELLKTFSGLAINKAWIREKEIIKRGFSGTGDWSPSEIAELLRSGMVRGFEVTEIQSIDKFPFLALDPTNREFYKFGQRGRKNRHRRKHQD